MKGQETIHTRQCCSRSTINPCHLLREFPSILSAVAPAAYLSAWSSAGGPWHGVRSCHYCCPGGRGCSLIPLTFHQQLQLSAQRCCFHFSSPSCTQRRIYIYRKDYKYTSTVDLQTSWVKNLIYSAACRTTQTLKHNLQTPSSVFICRCSRAQPVWSQNSGFKCWHQK